MSTGATTYIGNIDPLYPRPGQDNNSQGFRNNFNNIQVALQNLDTYMNSLAATTLNVDAPYVTATQILTTLGSLNIGDQTSIDIDFYNHNLVVTGRDKKNTLAAGSIAFFPSTVNLTINGYGPNYSYFQTLNTTTHVLEGATFTPINSTNTATYTVSKVDGYNIYFNPNQDLQSAGVAVTNPTFGDFTVINASTVSNLISQTLNGPTVSFSGNTVSDLPTNGTVVITGQGGLGVGGNVNIGGSLGVVGDLTLEGSLVTTSANNVFNGLTVNGQLILADANGDYIPTVSLSTSSFANSFAPGLFSGASGGYQKLPGGLIMQWGFTSPSPTSGIFTYDFPIPFPTTCMMILSQTGIALNVGSDRQTNGTQVINNTQFSISQDYGDTGASASQQYWFAIGY